MIKKPWAFLAKTTIGGIPFRRLLKEWRGGGGKEQQSLPCATIQAYQKLANELLATMCFFVDGPFLVSTIQNVRERENAKGGSKEELAMLVEGFFLELAWSSLVIGTSGWSIASFFCLCKGSSYPDLLCLNNLVKTLIF
ncbi:hypothetical protein D6783_05650 [Candidatus Woesearchaeota archaeon]|nr:MAG: hypothetical protein D6783_05650 [Candidatus Woesearchaeota archaeon]